MAKKIKEHTYDDLEDYLEIFQDETDRACAVLGAAHLDYLLAKAIEAHLPRGTEMSDELLFKPEAPIGTFSSRISMAFALDIISRETKEYLNTIRRIRNGFAHKMEIHSFGEDQSIIDRCNNLHISIKQAESYPEPHRSDLQKPRKLFEMTVISIQDDLRLSAGMISEKPRRVLMAKKVEDDR
jgi:hypothetical protein